MTEFTYNKFLRKVDEVLDVPPQTLGPLTPLYRFMVKRLKIMPWPALLMLSLLSMVCLYLALGRTIVFVASLLQRGF